MKTDRLYTLTLYLLNHGKTPASELAKYFEVSVRTIQRDIDALCQAGIPVYAVTGINGGYGITDSFRMDNQLVSKEDFAYIVTALYGLKTVTGNWMDSSIFEKIKVVSGNSNTGLVLDFSVLREGDSLLLQSLQSAVLNQKVVKFSYTNKKGSVKVHFVEPVAVIYKWYAWYMLAYDKVKGDYSTYKLVRMDNVNVTGENFSKKHIPAEEILLRCENNYKNSSTYTKVRLHCYNNAIYRIKEYLNGKIIKTFEDGSAIVETDIVEDGQWWAGVVLSQGKDAKILEPEHIKNKIIGYAEDILFLYGKL